VALPQLQVVDRLEVEFRALAHLAQDLGVLLGVSVGGLGIWQVGQCREELVALGVRLGELGLEPLELGLQRAGAVAQLLELRVVGLPALGRLLDLPGELVLLAADLVDPGVQCAAALVEPQQLVERVRGTTPGERGARRLGIAADLLQVKRGSAPVRDCLGG